MEKSLYLFDISRTDSATTLHWLGQQADTDPELSSAERREIHAAISARFGALNAAALPKRKPRWD